MKNIFFGFLQFIVSVFTIAQTPLSLVKMSKSSTSTSGLTDLLGPSVVTLSQCSFYHPSVPIYEQTWHNLLFT
ncbi:hypothetical protein C8J56DRAFT_952784 [Mycena floridula]|nr:hypothetical protein C8J56DRAFT_952784 [Mycena floridula]